MEEAMLPRSSHQIQTCSPCSKLKLLMSHLCLCLCRHYTSSVGCLDRTCSLCAVLCDRSSSTDDMQPNGGVAQRTALGLDGPTDGAKKKNLGIAETNMHTRPAPQISLASFEARFNVALARLSGHPVCDCAASAATVSRGTRRVRGAFNNFASRVNLTVAVPRNSLGVQNAYAVFTCAA